MNATLPGLVSGPFPSSLPAQSAGSVTESELSSTYPDNERTPFRGFAFALLFEAAGAVLAFAMWRLV